MPPRAGDGNRTHVACLEGRYSTIELHPRGRHAPGGRVAYGGLAGPRFGERPSRFGHRSFRVGLLKKVRSHRVGGAWVEQDSNLRRQCHQIYSLAPLTTWVSTRFGSNRHATTDDLDHRSDRRPGGRGPTRQTRAGGESRTHNRRFTKPVLCRLSYASHHEAVKLPNITTKTANASSFSIVSGNFKALGTTPTKSTAATGERFANRARSSLATATEAWLILAARGRPPQGNTARKMLALAEIRDAPSLPVWTPRASNPTNRRESIAWADRGLRLAARGRGWIG